MDDACEAAFVDFLGRALTVTDDERQLEQLLLKATRSAAAPRFRTPASATPTRPELCASMPELLTADVNGELDDDRALIAHIRHCARCQASAALLQRADAAFHNSLGWDEPAFSGPGAGGEAPESGPGAESPVAAPGAGSPSAPPPIARPRTEGQRRGGLVGAAKRFVRLLRGDGEKDAG